MEFFKKHYEKVLLSVVLLGLGAVAYLLPTAVRQAQVTIPETQPTRSTSNSVPPLSFEKANAALGKLTNPPVVDLSAEHRLFTPFTWKKMPNGSVKKFASEGVDGLSIIRGTNRPLNMVISLDRGTTNGFYMTVAQQSKNEIAKPFLKLTDKFIDEKTKNRLFTVKEVRGTTNQPEIVIELADSPDPVSIKRGVPFSKVEAYSTDLKYAPDNRDFLDKRLNNVITFGGQSYKIVAIESNKVSLVDQATGKQTTIP